MQKRIIECVPNFSEGRNAEVIKQITDVIDAAKGVKLLDVDPGEATNRTVVTFVGEPEAVCDAAVAAMSIVNKITFFIYEEMNACRLACQRLGLGKEDVEKIFYANSAKSVLAKRAT